MAITYNKGTKVLVRTYSAGVHFGELLEQDGMIVKLRNAKRLWSWEGAFTLHAVAQEGVDLKKSRISVSVEEIIIEGIEIIKCSDKTNIF